MNLVPIRELATFKHGGTPSKANAAYWRGEIPWVSPKDMKRTAIADAADHISVEAVTGSAASIVPVGSILIVVRSGILAHSLPVAQVTQPLAFNQDIKAVLPKLGTVDTDYLFWFLRAQAPRIIANGVKKGATVHSVQSSYIENLMVPLPALPEQRRIVDLLTRADGIVRLRREAAAIAAELIPALFVDMFGDPAANPKGLAMRKVAEVVARFEGGKNIQAGDGEASALRILKVSAVTSGAYLETECKPAPNGYLAPPRHLVKAGDLLFSRANTRELVGATALVEHTNGSTLLPDKLWRFVWREEVDSLYMWALFQSKAVRQELSKLASGTSDSMRNISQAKLFELALPVAALGEQRHFGEIINAARSIQKQQDMALAKAQATFNALLAQAFFIKPQAAVHERKS